LVGAGTAGGDWNGTPPFRQLPSKPSGFTHVIFISRVHYYSWWNGKNAAVGREITAGIARSHYFTYKVFL
jgi:hypothetical protein